MHKKKYNKVTVREITLFQLVMIAFSAMIGSGWMFSIWKAARIAGTSAILAWPLGAMIMLLLALNYAELSASYPKSGGMARFANLSHGNLTGFIAGWITWVSLIAVIPIEAISTIQYLSVSSIPWLQHLYTHESHQLNNTGALLAAILVFLFFLINYWSLKIFLRFTTLISIIKLIVPTLTFIALLSTSFHISRIIHPSHGFFSPNINQVFYAVATSGIIFSFHGFQSPINLAGEVKNPRRNLPLALLLSMLITFAIFELLQIVFIGSITQAQLVNGWQALNMDSPFVQLAIAINLNWLVMLLYINATIAPSGTAITYTATASRVLSGLEKSGFMPEILGYRHPLYQISRPAMWVNLIICISLLWFFRTWGQLVSIISVCIVLSYITGPVCVMVIRKHIPNSQQVTRIKGMSILAPLSFVLMSYVLYWAGWPLTGEVIFLILLGLPIFFFYQWHYQAKDQIKGIISGIWLLGYLACMITLSYIGDPHFGGHGWISNAWVNINIAIIALAFFYLGYKSGWATQRMQQWKNSLNNQHQSTTPPP